MARFGRRVNAGFLQKQAKQRRKIEAEKLKPLGDYEPPNVPEEFKKQRKR